MTTPPAHNRKTTKPPVVLTYKTNPLSPRERAVLTALCNGMTRNEVAVEWGITIGTVNNLIRFTHVKLQCRTTMQAIAVALDNKWID